jgi:uncharacterized protein
MTNKNPNVLLRDLNRWLDCAGTVGIAASGGVDSTTLAIAANRHLPGKCKVYHASSPAVPKLATKRLAVIADDEGWEFEIINAGEFEDPNYLKNPVNRCFFCKKNLYGTIASNGVTEQTLLSGTNLDDMGDFRPGLQAAKTFQVKHPYVDLGIDKASVRTIAEFLGYEDLAEMPASPCLSSRIETGIRVDPRTLLLVDAVEQYVNSNLPALIVRCRIRGTGLVVELDDKCLSMLGSSQRTALGKEIKRMSSESGIDFPVEFALYRQGSAFVHDEEK